MEVARLIRIHRSSTKLITYFCAEYIIKGPDSQKRLVVWLYGDLAEDPLINSINTLTVILHGLQVTWSKWQTNMFSHKWLEESPTAICVLHFLMFKMELCCQNTVCDTIQFWHLKNVHFPLHLSRFLHSADHLYFICLQEYETNWSLCFNSTRSYVFKNILFRTAGMHLKKQVKIFMF